MVTTITLGCVRPQKQLLLKNDSAPALLATERLPPLKKSPKPRVGAWEGMHPAMAQVKDGKTRAKETDCDARRVLEDRLRERKERCLQPLTFHDLRSPLMWLPTSRSSLLGACRPQRLVRAPRKLKCDRCWTPRQNSSWKR